MKCKQSPPALQFSVTARGYRRDCHSAMEGTTAVWATWECTAYAYESTLPPSAVPYLEHLGIGRGGSWPHTSLQSC